MTPEQKQAIETALEKLSGPCKVSDFDGTSMLPELVREVSARRKIAKEALDILAASLTVEYKIELVVLAEIDDLINNVVKCIVLPHKLGISHARKEARKNANILYDKVAAILDVASQAARVKAVKECAEIAHDYECNEDCTNAIMALAEPEMEK